MKKPKKLVPGWLYNKKKGYPYPEGKLFINEAEYNQALREGWKETPYEPDNDQLEVCDICNEYTGTARQVHMHRISCAKRNEG